MAQIIREVAKASMAHEIYRNRKGQRVPSVSKVIGVMDKPGLVKWANELGLQGINSYQYVDILAGAGTLAHAGVLADLMDTVWDTAPYSKDQINMAKKSVRKWFKWLDKQKFKMLWAERSLVSEKYQFGGRLDIYGILNGKKTLLDIKTTKKLYDNHATQTAGYRILLLENKFPVDESRLLRLPRTDDEGMEPEDKLIEKIELHTRRFLKCRELLELNDQINFQI